MDDENEEDDETGRNCDDAMTKETAANDQVSQRESNNSNVEDGADMKAFNAEDEGDMGNTLYADDGFPSTPIKQERNDVKRVRGVPDKQPAVSPPAVDARESVLREPAVSFAEPFGSSVARLESFVASVVAADRKRPVPFRERPSSPPLPPPRNVQAAPPLPPVTPRSRHHSKVARMTSRTLKSPTSMSQSATGGRVQRTSRGPAQINVPPSFVSPPPSGQPAVDQPLDLSTKSTRESQYLCPDVASAGPSSLLSLERQFGKGSAIFDRIGTKAWAAPYCATALRLGVRSLAFGSSLGLVSPPSPSTSRRLAPGRPCKDRETVTYPLVARQQPPPTSPTATDVAALLPWAQPPESKRTSSSSTLTSSGAPPSSHIHTNLRCGCGASMDNLFALTVHLQKTGHAPAAPASLLHLPVSAGGASERPSPATTSATTGSRPAEYSKLVRGQDVWLSGGGERTRRSILRCIQCGESFRSLPELTVHMVHTRHYTNIVGGPTSSSTTSGSGHVTSELPVVGSTHGRKQQLQQQLDRTAGSGCAKTRKSPTVTSRESVKSTSPGNPMTSSSSPCLLDDGDPSACMTTTEYHDVTPRRSISQSPASLPEMETGRQLAERESKTSSSMLIGEARAESAIKAMESLIQSNFGRASPLEESCCESPSTVSSGCRSQSVPARGDEETQSRDSVGPGGDAGRPLSATVHSAPSPAPCTETPRRARTLFGVAEDHVDDDEDFPTTPKRSPSILPDADSSTFSAAAQDHDNDVVKEEVYATSRLEQRLRVGDEATADKSMKRRATNVEGSRCSDAKRRAEDRQQIRQNSDLDQTDDDRPTSTSGRLTSLESLQGLVYRQTLSSEHPLDSLQRLIYGSSGTTSSHVSVQLTGSQNTGGSADLDQFQTGRSPVLAPQTLIIVNPIVTVVSQGGGSDVPVPGGPSTPKPSAPTGGGGGSAGESSGSSEDAGEQAVPVPRTYRCRACRRKFSSKGSYRYHVSRCHMLATAASPKAACEAPSRHKYHPHHHHHRDSDANMAATASEPSSDVTISAGSAFGSCAPLEDSGRRLQAHYFAEAK